MDSQSRTRLLVGGLTLVAVILVISLLVSQQRSRLPVAVESPLAEEAGATPTGATHSPLGLPGPESPLSRSGSAAAATLTVTHTVVPSATVTDTGALTEDSSTGSSAISGTISSTVPVTEPLTVSVQSRVTVSLASPLGEPYSYEVIATYPHDPEAFTQGLQYVDGVLYEGTGLYGRSTLRRVDLESGTVEQAIDLPAEYFGEGITVLGDRIYQLTWQSHVAFLYDRESFEKVDEFSYPTEGWGLTFDGEHLLMSDGSATIFRRDPETFEEVGRFVVRDKGALVNMLNELEYVDGTLWANIWMTDQILLIDPISGEVNGRVDLAGLLSEEDAAGADVLNGIAYDEENNRLFVTGKLWPKLFQIKLAPR